MDNSKKHITKYSRDLLSQQAKDGIVSTSTLTKWDVTNYYNQNRNNMSKTEIVEDIRSKYRISERYIYDILSGYQ